MLMKVWKKYFSIIMICNERQVKEAEGEKAQFILCWRAKENMIIEELAKNRNMQFSEKQLIMSCE